MYGHRIDSPPDQFGGAESLLRLIDGLAFRYHWATEGLRDEDVSFRPASDCMSTAELLDHILMLAIMIEQAIRNAPERRRYPKEEGPLPEKAQAESLRSRTLQVLSGVRDHLVSLPDSELGEHRVLKRSGEFFSIWHIINGPIADALTHVGQLNSWRRLSGNPSQRIDVFQGRPPI